jgi:hypothetical protein
MKIQLKNIIKYLSVKNGWQPLLFTFIVLINSCIAQFVPETTEDQDILVVEGIITDQPGPKIIKLSTTMPLGAQSSAKTLSGCNVTLSDNLGNNFDLNETTSGSYSTSPAFQGVIGRSYTLHIKTNGSRNNRTYESEPVLLRPVPPIDSIYYNKVVLTRSDDGYSLTEGCQIYLDTHDPENNCKYYRWEYVETWEFQLPYNYVQNRVCWTTANSNSINIKNTSTLSEDKIVRQPLNYITNGTDRLKIRYSILVNQYSLSEEEYTYWEKLQNVVEQVGSLFDIIPASIPSNIKCIEKPEENVLGFFSVSAISSKRIFIPGHFKGIIDLYTDCENVVVGGNDSIPGLGTTVWVIINNTFPPPFKVLTYFKSCADCTTRGTTIKPAFWQDSN